MKDKKQYLSRLEKIREMITHYEKIANKDGLIEELIEENITQLDGEFKRTPWKLITLKEKYKEIKKRKEFSIFHCVRCDSHENMAYQTATRKMQMRSGPINVQHTVTYQNFEFDFPVCGKCKKKIERLETIDGLSLLIFLGWIIGFGGYGVYTIFQTTSIVLPIIFISIAVIGGIGFWIGKLVLRFLKYWPRRFVKIKVKFIGRGTPHRGKNYEGIPMVKPVDSKKWISYESWVKPY
ncbi:hypothetical protein LCGC14_1711810 [marine sediment metagenome]|uniref:Uncharacterized protein n=1 Tax=marine sediment metagenome TaxID=412755 RepID=A0A0F9HFH3_9ZZZZ